MVPNSLERLSRLKAKPRHGTGPSRHIETAIILVVLGLLVNFVYQVAEGLSGFFAILDSGGMAWW